MNQHACLNRFYRLVWSACTQSWHVVSEITRGQGKGSGRRRSNRATGAIAALVLAASGSLAMAQQAPPAANQLPVGASVSAGIASISSQVNASSASMTVQQATQRAVINWNSFNVGQNASVNFQQPSTTSLTLNRITDPNPSQIFGQIQANGQVLLSNPSGIYFSPTSRVDVGGLVATTHSLSDQDFMAGRMDWSRQGATGSVINEGSLQSGLQGYVALLAPEVRNAGVVVARSGSVVMASGDMVSLQFDANQSLTGIVTTPSTIASLIDNRQAVRAPDGQIILSAMALNQLQAGVIRNTGVLEASSLTSRGGKIVLEADQIELKSGSALQTNGPTGGGTVLVGGDWQGSGNVRHASQVSMEAGATIEANALSAGNGGKVVLWSDVQNPDSITQAQGRIEAKGGQQSGDGGQVETSGHRLNVNGVQVSTAAPAGQAGQWLLDPTDLVIAASGGDVTGATITAALANSSQVYVRSDNSLAGYITTRVGGGSNGSNGDIFINDNISITTRSKLYFNASGVIYGPGNITVSGSFTPSQGMTFFGVAFNQLGNSIARGLSYTGVISGGATVTESWGTRDESFVISVNEFSPGSAANGGVFAMSSTHTITSPRIEILSGTLALIGSGGFTQTPSLDMRDMFQGGMLALNPATLNISQKTGDFSINGLNSTRGGSMAIVLGNNNLNITASQLVGMVGVPQVPGYVGFEGVISGTGGVRISVPYNSSTEQGFTLSGANTYTGPTTVGSNLTLLLKGSGSIAASSSVTVNGKLDIGGITGASASISQLSGTGTVYTNSPARSGNIWGTPYSFSAGSGKELDISNVNASTTFSGSITGTGSLKVAAGTQILTGNNTYTGATTIDSGATLQIGSGGTAGTLASASNIAVDGTLAINLSNARTLSNNISGSGAVTNLGAGTTLLTGTVANTVQISPTQPAGRLCVGQCPFDITTLTTSAQIQALTSSDISSMSSGDIQLITATQLGYFTNAQLAVWNNTQLGLLTSTQLPGLTASQIRSLNTSQLGAWNASQIAALNTTQLAALSASQVPVLTNAQLTSLSASQVAALRTGDLIATQWASLTNAQLTSLSAGQLAALNSSQLGALTTGQLASLAPTQLASLSAGQISGLNSSQLGALVAAQVAALSSTQLGGLSAAQIAALNSTQLAALTTGQLAGLLNAQLTNLSAAQLAALNSTQLGALTTTQLASLAPTQLLSLSATQIGNFSSTQLGALVAAQVAALSNTQLGGLSAAQIAGLNSTQLGALTTSQLASLSTLQLGSLTASQIASLSNSQAGALTTAQISGLSVAQVPGLTQLAALSANQLAALSTSQVAALSNAQLGGLNAAQIAGLSSTQLGALTTTQLASLAPAQLASLSAGQIGGLSAPQLGALVAAQVAALNNTQLGGLSAAQIAGLGSSQLAALTTSQLAGLAPSQLGSLTATQLGNLSNTQIGALTTAQITALATGQIAGLSAAQIGSLSPAQVAAFSATQLTSLSSAQVAGLTATQRAALSPTQLTALPSSNASAATDHVQSALVSSVTPSASARASNTLVPGTGAPTAVALTLEVVVSNSTTVPPMATSSLSNTTGSTPAGTTSTSASAEAESPSTSASTPNADKRKSDAAEGNASRTGTANSKLPVVAARWVSNGTAGTGLVDVQLPSHAIGNNASTVVIQLPPQAAAATSTANTSVKLSSMDNAPAPSWVQYSAPQGGLVVGNVPSGALPVQVKLSIGNQQVTVQINAAGN